LAPDKLYVETVEKVELDRIRWFGREFDLSGCFEFDDFILGMGQKTPENHPMIVMLDFFYRLVS